MMRIELTRAEAERLIELVALASWVLHGHAGADRGELGHGAVMQKLYEAAEEAGLGFLVEYDEETETYRPSGMLEARLDLAGYIDDYDDCVFWDELALRLAERDLKEELGDAEYESMPRENREDREDEIAAEYDQEFEKRGLKRLRLEPSMRGRRRRDALNEQLKKLFGG